MPAFEPVVKNDLNPRWRKLTITYKV